MIVFIDEKNIVTDYLVKYENLFEKVWSYDEPSITKVKLNIVNNLLLSPSGFDAVLKHLSQIYIVLYGTKFVSEALTFCFNYFLRTEYELGPSSRFNLL